MTAPGARALEFAQAVAYADMFRAAPAELGFAVEEIPCGLVLRLPAVDALVFNRVILLDGDAPGLEDAVARFSGANFGVQVAPALASPAVESRLASMRLARRDAWVRFHRDAGRVSPARTDLRIAPVGPEDGTRFGEVVCTGFGLPRTLAPALAALVGRTGWHPFLAWDGETAVAGACLFVREETGWLGVAATLPEARGRGAQSALLARRLEEGLRLGCREFVLETAPDRPDRPNPSLHNALRAGFVAAYEFPNWMPIAPVPAGD